MAADQEALDRVVALRHERNVGKQIAAPAQSLVETNQLLRAARAPKPRGMDAGKTEVRIVADDRENAGGVIAALRELPGSMSRCGDCPAVTSSLGTSSPWNERRCAISRARSSTAGCSGRRRPLVVTRAAGCWSWREAAPICTPSACNAEALQGALICVSVFLGMSVLRAHDPAETARLIVYLGRQAKAYAHGSHPRPGYRPKGRRARQLFLLQGLPRVGPERAARLLDHFGSVQAWQRLRRSIWPQSMVSGSPLRLASAGRWARRTPRTIQKSQNGALDQSPDRKAHRLTST